MPWEGSGGWNRRMTIIRIPTRLNGLEDAAQGGIASGLFAQLVGGTATVRLRERIPLDTDLEAHRGTDGVVSIEHAGDILATATPTTPFHHDPPLRPTFADALDAARRHPLRGIRHPFSDCVVCSPSRPDGLGVVSGTSLQRPDVLLAPLQATPAFVTDGRVRPEALWGALDCTSFPADLLRTRTLAVTGQLTAHIERDVSSSERLVVVGWRTGRGDRSHRTATAVIDESGEVVASADAVWVEVAFTAVGHTDATTGSMTMPGASS